MRDETIWIVAVAIILYYVWYGKKRRPAMRAMQSAWQGATVNTQGSSAGAQRWGKGLPSTPTQGNGKGFRYAPIANPNALNGVPQAPSGPGSPTALGSQQGSRSSPWSGWGASFVAPQWPNKKVTSTGTTTVGSTAVQVPSYTTVPLTPVGPGGGGSIIYAGTVS